MVIIALEINKEGLGGTAIGESGTSGVDGRVGPCLDVVWKALT